MFSLICAWINPWVNNREAGDLRLHHAHYDVFVIYCKILGQNIVELLHLVPILNVKGRYNGFLVFNHIFLLSFDYKEYLYEGIY